MDKKTVIKMLQSDFSRFHQDSLEISAAIQNYKHEIKNYMNDLLTNIGQADSLPLLAKTPKNTKKRGTRIKAIPENSEMDVDTSDASSSRSSRADTLKLETPEVRPSRVKRGASVKAADVIKKQSSVTLNTKLRRPSKEDDEIEVIPKENGYKRVKESLLVSSEDEEIRPSKQMKIEKKKYSKNKINDETHDIINDSLELKKASLKRKLQHRVEDENTTLVQSPREQHSPPDGPAAKKGNYFKSQKSEKEAKQLGSILERISEKSPDDNQRATRSSASSIRAPYRKGNKKNNIINETMDMTNPDETVASMYEDALAKPVPIMNSTMNPNSTITLDKMLTASVLLEPLNVRKIMNETVTIKKGSFKEPLSCNNSTLKETVEVGRSGKPMASTAATSYTKKDTISKILKDPRLEKFNELITDDESSPERKDSKAKKEKLVSKQLKRVTRSSQSIMSDEDEIQKTPPSKTSNKNFTGSAVKSSYKPSALFSPYAKESVKKKVEAFEQVASSPKQDLEIAGRVTRTKTRALASTAGVEVSVPTVTQKLARKSLAKAKKISLAKHARDPADDAKENENFILKTAKKTSSASEKSTQKAQAKTTPLSKNRMLQGPGSAQKYQFTTPSNSHNLNSYSKPLTASRGNIVTHVDSFIQPNKSASKTIDRTAEEKRRRAHEEDAKRKREELLKAQAEEKRRKREEKELKNKLAREAKEKMEQEKRRKAEIEKEEKAKAMQQLLEKQREELERKRQMQLQRAHEKEEKRRQEELLRLQRVQEQEEQERQLAEQKRREQEMEKRKLAEMKHQEIKYKQEKALALAKSKSLAQQQKHLPATYKIDSDPDEEESDDESKPKHQIPYWASKNVRHTQLSMQKHLPMKLVLKFFNAKKCSPDLRDLFQGIDPKKLKRSSSAIWKTPPQYSMMNSTIIEDDE